MVQNQNLDVSEMNQDSVNKSFENQTSIDFKTKFNLKIVQQAASNLNLKSYVFGEYQDILRVNFSNNKNPLYFWRNRHPFNHSLTEVGKEKVLQLQILEDIAKKQTIPFLIPKTYFVFNSNSESVRKIIKDLESKFIYPFIFKKSNGGFSQDVYLVHTRDELERVIKRYLNISQDRYFLLFQEYITGMEYRVVSKYSKARLIYSKPGNARFQNSIYTNSKKLTDKIFWDQFNNISKFLFENLSLNFSGNDFIITKDRKIYLIELNYFPVAYYYCAFFDKQDFIQLYQEFLQEYQSS